MRAMVSTRAIRLSLALLTGWATAGSAQTAAGRPIPAAKTAEGSLSFDGRANVGDFTGTTTTLSGEMSGGADLSAVRGWVESPVATLKTGKDRRDRDLLKSMEADKYPTLRFDLDAVAGQNTGDSVPVTLKGRLSIHGIARAVELPGSVVLSADHARVHSDFPLNLKDYKIGGLSKMMGMLRMYEDIKVHVDVTFRFAAETGER
jgi:polyisoprenoid-binding protein YceI